MVIQFIVHVDITWGLVIVMCYKILDRRQHCLKKTRIGGMLMTTKLRKCKKFSIRRHRHIRNGNGGTGNTNSKYHLSFRFHAMHIYLRTMTVLWQFGFLIIIRFHFRVCVYFPKHINLCKYFHYSKCMSCNTLFQWMATLKRWR